MKVSLIAIGKTSQDFVQKGLDEFCSRIKHYLPFELSIIPDMKNSKKGSNELQKEKEGELILKVLQPGDYVILLDENGKEFSSVQFAEYFEKKTHLMIKRMVFIIGGPYGFSSKIHSIAQEKISLSKMTFSHQLIRLIFAEQFYRAMTILNNEPYHHE